MTKRLTWSVTLNSISTRRRGGQRTPCTHGSRLLMLVALLLVALVSRPALSSAVTTSPTSDNASVAKRELELIKGLKFKPWPGQASAQCRTFLKEFERQKNIHYPIPLIETNDYDEPRLMQYKRQCPNLDFRRTLGPTGAGPNAFVRPGEKLNEDDFNVYLDTRHFRIYELDMDHNPANGKEIIYYGEAPKHVKSGGIPVSNAYPLRQLGRYKVIDLKNCTELGYMSVGVIGKDQMLRWILDSPTGPQGDVTVHQHGVIEYQGGNAIFKLTVYPAGRYADGTRHGPTGTLLLYQWQKSSDGTYRFGEDCLFRTRD